jgi:hypothetical protein
MFFSYPIAATTDNWLHDCLCEMLMSVHGYIEAGKNVPDWPNIIPPAYRKRLQTRTGLRDRLKTYAKAAQKLTPEELAQVELCLIQQNDIAALLSCSGECEALTDLPEIIRQPATELFTFAFNLLDDLAIRDRQYQEIYNVISSPVCPFCGSEYFDAPQSHREDLDHYLTRTIYPFAAANLRNLVPMGSKCNGYKLDQDMLRDAAGARRPSFDPYGEHKLTVSLVNSPPFGGEDGQTPEWQIDFVPDSAECVTWDTVFFFRERIEKDILKRFFRPWLGQFAAWFVKRKRLADVTDNRIIESLLEYQEDMKLQGFTARDFLRAHVFEMLALHCKKGDKRLLALMRDLVTEAVPQLSAAVD